MEKVNAIAAIVSLNGIDIKLKANIQALPNLANHLLFLSA
jgi:hypothetical protein